MAVAALRDAVPSAEAERAAAARPNVAQQIRFALQRGRDRRIAERAPKAGDFDDRVAGIREAAGRIHIS